MEVTAAASQEDAGYGVDDEQHPSSTLKAEAKAKAKAEAKVKAKAKAKATGQDKASKAGERLHEPRPKGRGVSASLSKKG